MGSLAAIVIVGLLAYLGAGRLFRASDLRSGPRYFLLSGVEFAIVGLVFGPEVTGLVGADAASSLAPVFHLVVGWVGISVGLEIPLPSLRRVDRRVFALSGLETACVLAVVSVSTWLAARLDPTVAAVPTALVLGAAAALTAPSAFGVVEREYRPRGPATELTRLLTSFSTLGSVAAFGLFAACTRTAGAGPLDAPEWLLISLVLGAALGAIAHLATSAARDEGELLVLVLGCAVFAGGVLIGLRLSPLAPGLVAGMVLGSMTRHRDRLERITRRLERPLYLALLLFAGLVWRPGTVSAVIVAGVFLAARMVAKLAGGWLASRLVAAWHPGGFVPVRRLGLALLPHGGLAVSMALSYTMLRGGTEGDLVLSAVLVSVIASSVASPHLVRNVLRENGEIR